MRNHQIINESIANREICTSFDEATYYTQSIFNEFCEHMDLKRVAIFGFYKSKYSWTDDQAWEMYNKSPDGWTDGLGVYRHFDWGKGENQIPLDHFEKEWHLPELDHIVSKDEAGRLGWDVAKRDDPSNFQVLPKIINRIKNNLSEENVPAVLPVLVGLFPNVKLK